MIVRLFYSIIKILIDSFANLDALKNHQTQGLGAKVFLSTVFLTPIGGAIISTIINKKEITQSKYYKMPNSPLKKSTRYISSYNNKTHALRQNRVANSFARWFSNLFVFVWY
jgi:hypothetical protein